MPFTFKLSQRLARIKAASLLLPAAALVIASCDLRPRGSGTGVDNPVTQVFVSPDSLILDPLQSYQFHVFGRTQAGDSVPVSVRWSASAGLITSSGMYTADTSANDVLVTAMLTTSTTSGTSNVKKRRLIQIVINPATSSVLTGAMQQFTAYGRRNTGDSVSVSVTYSATGGIISGSGAYTAGQTPGAYQVTAKQNGGSLTDTAAVTVASAPPPPPPGSPGTVTDLAVASITDNAATLSFTEVNNGSGAPANYDIRLAVGTISWGSAPSVTQGTCQLPVSGTAIGAKRSCTVLGLAASTAYQFQLIAFQGTLNVNAVFGNVSNVVSGTTATQATAAAATVSVSPTGVSQAAGMTQLLAATVKDANGSVLTGQPVTWS